MRPSYLENACEILNDAPVIVVKLILSHLQMFVGSNHVNHKPVCKHKFQHVTTSWGMSHFLEMVLAVDVVPSWESDCS